LKESYREKEDLWILLRKKGQGTEGFCRPSRGNTRKPRVEGKKSRAPRMHVLKATKPVPKKKKKGIKGDQCLEFLKKYLGAKQTKGKRNENWNALIVREGGDEKKKRGAEGIL